MNVINFSFKHRVSSNFIKMVLQYRSLYFILEKNLLLSRNQVFGLRKWKLLGALSLVKVIIFIWKLVRLSQSNAYKTFRSSFGILCCAVVIKKDWKTWVPEVCREARVLLHLAYYLLILGKWKKSVHLLELLKKISGAKMTEKQNNSC